MAEPENRSRRTDNELYERYVKPLERTHWGEYVAVSASGDTMVGSDLMELVDKATATFGPGSEVFKVGERVVGRWR